MDPNPTQVSAARCRVNVLARLLIGTYFIAHAAGLVIAPGTLAFVTSPWSATVLGWAITTMIWLTGVTFLFGRNIRPAAVILGLHMLGTTVYEHAGLFGADPDMAVLASEILMVMVIGLFARNVPQGRCQAPVARTGYKGPGGRSAPMNGRPKLELAATRAALKELQASDGDISYKPTTLRRSA